MIDIVYFGYECNAASGESRFLKEIKERFGEAVQLSDAYDSIKGHRQEVRFEDTLLDDYCVFLMLHGWFSCSFKGQITILSKDTESQSLFDKWMELAKKKKEEDTCQNTET